MKKKMVMLISAVVLIVLAGCGAAVVLYLRAQAIDSPTALIADPLSAPPELRVVCDSEEVIATSGNYTWGYELGEIGNSTIACGMHPLDAREYQPDVGGCYL